MHYDRRDIVVLTIFTAIMLFAARAGGAFQGLFDAALWQWQFDASPLLNSSSLVFVHLVAGIGALATALAIFSLRKGSRQHKLLGRIFGGLVVINVIVAALFRPGPLNGTQIAALSALVILPLAIWSIRRGDVRRHRTFMAMLAIACVLNTVLGFLPGRTMHTVFFAQG